MASTAGNVWRLLRAGRTLAAYDALLPAQHLVELPASARLMLSTARFGRRAERSLTANPLADALVVLGPSYIKLGQFLATRSDLVGPVRARDLTMLQDRLTPFPQEQALSEIRRAFGAEPAALFSHFGEPVAAASIAQVHRARTAGGREVAVKILRPGIEKQFSNDVESFLFAAKLIERWHKPSRRLRPLDAVLTLAQSVQLEMDLRMEAAAIAEMGQNVKNDTGFRVPEVDWARTAQRILTTDWIDGLPLGDVEGLKRAGHEPEKSPRH